GLRLFHGGTSHVEGEIEQLASNWPAAERVLREGYEVLDAIGETSYLSTVASSLAEAIYRQDRLQEAEHLTQVSNRTPAPADQASQVGWRSIRALVLARRGEPEKSTALAREAVELARQSDFINVHAPALLALADVLTSTGNPSQAIPAIKEAFHIYERKGNL